ncbi:MarR family winged helix-turn-helix transcriptional regulator [Nonomuraea sp. NEAU-A123]|uniref:MarR family winged helix-turn-helix transcriptional regulator n=1 Tax=Nonomuraea sp. NEAU-A123 TaxID=2839649 RepID=UPI001BE3D145|nr:MarR family transcriptional regulator [Nonomuraea sp. NEAU-A123]MBT2225820.1 MarR family transcriptional regulator [Nonomuraea sp. NEAU-A123]
MSRSTDRVRELWAAARPDLDTSPMEVIGPLKRVIALLGEALDPLYVDAALTGTELDVCLRLRHDPSPTIARRLADQMRHSRAAISKTLTRLESRGLVVREPSPADRRASLVRLTPAGEAAVDAIFPRQLAREAELLEGLGADRERVIEALNLLADVLGKRM